MARTGQKRKVRQPFSVDKFPAKVRDKIQDLRAKGSTWEEIEEASAEWETGRIPRSNLQRWYDVRVEQVIREQEERFAIARKFAEKFANRGVDKLPETIVNAMTECSFALMQAQGDRNQDKAIAALDLLGNLVVKFERNKLADRKLGIEGQKLELLKSKIVGLKKEVAGKKKVDPAGLQRRLDELYGIVQGDKAK